MSCYVQFLDVQFVLLIEDDDEATTLENVRDGMSKGRVIHAREPLTDHLINLGQVRRVDVVGSSEVTAPEHWTHVKVRTWSEIA